MNKLMLWRRLRWNSACVESCRKILRRKRTITPKFQSIFAANAHKSLPAKTFVPQLFRSPGYATTSFLPEFIRKCAPRCVRISSISVFPPHFELETQHLPKNFITPPKLLSQNPLTTPSLLGGGITTLLFPSLSTYCDCICGA